MKPLFTFLSISYIAAIFLLADSSAVSNLSPFNPYSLLHIALYGILTLLLIFSFIPITQLRCSPLNRRLTQLHNKLKTQLPNNLKSRFLVVGLIASIVAIADEIYQSFIPFREASVTDVLLDLIGISLAIILISKYNKKSQQLLGE